MCCCGCCCCCFAHPLASPRPPACRPASRCAHDAGAPLSLPPSHFGSTARTRLPDTPLISRQPQHPTPERQESRRARCGRDQRQLHSGAPASLPPRVSQGNPASPTKGSSGGRRAPLSVYSLPHVTAGRRVPPRRIVRAVPRWVPRQRKASDPDRGGRAHVLVAVHAAADALLLAAAEAAAGARDADLEALVAHGLFVRVTAWLIGCWEDGGGGL